MDRIFRIVELLHKCKADKLDVSEQKELEEWLRVDGNRKWVEYIGTEKYEAKVLQDFRKYHSAKAYRRFARQKPVARIQIQWNRVAAVILPKIVRIKHMNLIISML